ncbi:hypothetical protein [Prosthecobacter vanneervenii]|uniref:Uncharacterized protein n=1 Tax=Prosthecobacter vanneervenii TaxID=48466 RepID=A0A7W7YAA8_9BACT|nr:hypothetical protein [Prosthecobacter vanneervenii]MBB5032528.1 hypothetical protein [Prosthecobacter vanneervenii]
MIRPHTPPETPADKPARSGEAAGTWASPWELDLEWMDAPKGKRIRPAEPKKAATPPVHTPQAMPPPVAASSPAQRQPVSEVEKDDFIPRQAPPSRLVKKAQPPPRGESEASWPTLIILSMGLLAFVFIIWLYVDDQTPGLDTDFLVNRPVDQAATIQTPEKLRKLLGSLVPFDDGQQQGTPPWLWDTPTLSRVVQANGLALENLRDLLEDADWHPAHASWHAADPCVDPRWRQLMVLKQAEAAYLSRRMQEDSAFTAAIDLAELGWRLEQLWAWPSCYRQALQAQALASQTMADLLRQTRLPEATLRQFQRQFSVCQPTAEMLVGAMSAFYVHEKKLILGPKSGESLDTMPGGVALRRPGRLFFKPYETLQHFATAFRQIKAEVPSPLALTSEVRLKESINSEASYQPNSSGLAYYHQRMRLYTPMPAELGLARARANLIITLFAVRRCIAEKKSVPASLEELRTFNFLLDVPVDPYSGAPLFYNRTSGLIWSVGRDLKSANGSPTEPPMSDAMEPTVEVGIAVAAVAK